MGQEWTQGVQMDRKEITFSIWNYQDSLIVVLPDLHLSEMYPSFCNETVRTRWHRQQTANIHVISKIFVVHIRLE